jgi:hypothetical protein
MLPSGATRRVSKHAERNCSSIAALPGREARQRADIGEAVEA